MHGVCVVNQGGKCTAAEAMPEACASSGPGAGLWVLVAIPSLPGLLCVVLSVKACKPACSLPFSFECCVCPLLLSAAVPVCTVTCVMHIRTHQRMHILPPPVASSSHVHAHVSALEHVLGDPGLQAVLVDGCVEVSLLCPPRPRGSSTSGRSVTSPQQQQQPCSTPGGSGHDYVAEAAALLAELDKVLLEAKTDKSHLIRVSGGSQGPFLVERTLVFNGGQVA